MESALFPWMKASGSAGSRAQRPTWSVLRLCFIYMSMAFSPMCISSLNKPLNYLCRLIDPPQNDRSIRRMLNIHYGEFGH